MQRRFFALRKRTTGLWQNTDFLTLWAGETLSMFGSGITTIALPLVAVITLGASAWQMGVLRALNYVPSIVFGLFAGVLVDRVRRKPLLIGANIGKAFVLSVPPLAAALGLLRIELLYGVIFASGILSVFLNLAFFSFFPALVGRDDLMEGNGKFETSSALAQIVGPGIAGVLVQVLTAPGAIVIDVCSFLIAAVAVGRTRTVELPPAPSSAQRHLGAEIAEGIRAFRDNGFLRAFTFSSATFDVFGNAIFTVYFLYTSHVLHLSPLQIGLIFGIGSIGALIGSFVARSAGQQFGLGLAIIGAQALIGVAGLLIACAVALPERALLLLTVAEFAQSLFNTIYNVNRTSVSQATTPDRVRGRVRAATTVVSISAALAGSLLGGVIGQVVGVEQTLVLGALGGIVPFIWLIFSPVRTLRTMPALQEEA